MKNLTLMEKAIDAVEHSNAEHITVAAIIKFIHEKHQEDVSAGAKRKALERGIKRALEFNLIAKKKGVGLHGSFKMPSQANLKKAQKAYLESRSGPKEAREARSRSVEPGTSKAVAKVASKKSSKVGPKKATKSASVGAAVKSEKVKKESKKAKVQEEPIPETDAAEKPKTARLRAGTAIEDPENEVVDSPPKPKKGSKASTKKTDAEMASSTNGNAEEAQDEPTEPAPKDKKGKKAAAKKVEPEPETNGQDEESAETRKGRRSGGKKAETPKEAPKEKKKPANTKKAASVKRGATDTELAEHANKKLRVQSEMNTKADPNASMDSEN